MKFPSTHLSLAPHEDSLWESLKGLSGVYVMVIVNGEKAPVSSDSLAPHVELALRRSGIRIVQKEKVGHKYPTITLLVAVGTLGNAFTVSAYAIESVVSSESRYILMTGVSIWWTDSLNIGVTSGHILDVVKSTVDVFANDYLKANPKK